MFAFGRKKEKSLKTEGSITSTDSTNERESKEEKERRKKEKKEAKKAAKQGNGFYSLFVIVLIFIYAYVSLKNSVFFYIFHCRSCLFLWNWSFQII